MPTSDPRSPDEARPVASTVDPATTAAHPLGARPPRLSMTVLELSYTPEGPLALPLFVGGMLRGVLGNALRAIACSTGADTCAGCPVADRCAYGALWETTRADGPKRFATPPRAYALEPIDPLTHRGDAIREPGDAIRFRLKLFGAARGWQPQVVSAAAGAAELGWGADSIPMRLQSIDRIEPDDGHVSLWSPLRGPRVTPIGPGHIVDPAPATSPTAPPGPRRVRLELRTPVALTVDKRPAERFDAIVFTKRLCQRLDMLARAHEGAAVEWDFRTLWRLAERARVVRDETRPARFQRYSMRQARRIGVGGLIGRVELDDVDPQLVNVWRCAAAAHVGKGAAFGLGHVTLTEMTRDEDQP